ncbi:leiomodin-1 isoform X2 [Hyperolius riggenbachi]|uniref:leiomodin-1 isoform X2 n=1 Tax=Hyperolius riggenbachi TaxID=752182 RepID=UPI0035A3778C
MIGRQGPGRRAEDMGIPVARRRSLESHCTAPIVHGTQKSCRAQNEKSSLKTKEETKKEEKGKEQDKGKGPSISDRGSVKVQEEAKDSKTKGKKDLDKPKDDRVSKMRERFKQEKNNSAVDKGKLERTPSKKQEEEQNKRQTSKEKAEKESNDTKSEKKVVEKTENKLAEKTEKKALEKTENKPLEKTENKALEETENKAVEKTAKKEMPEVQTENKQDKKTVSDKPPEKPDRLEKAQASKSTTQEKPPAEQDKKNSDIQKPENGTKNATEENKEDSIFDELLEKVKNNEPEMTELNLNNSECITIDTLMSFTEALEFNTVVKTFSLANTRADDHIALAIAVLLKSNKTITSINLDSNHITGKGILAIFRALQHNDTLIELRFHNQRHICGGKTEMEIAKILKENTTLLKLGYHFELAGPRMTVTNLLSRNMDKQRQRRMAEQKALKEAESKKNCLEVPKVIPPPKEPPKSFAKPAPNNPPKGGSKKGGIPVPPPPPPPPMAPLAPPLFNENIRNSLSPASQRRIVDKAGPGEKNTRDKLLESIRTSNIKQLKKVEVPKWLR